MRLYHPEHGYHFGELEEFKKLGWISAPKGFQKTLKAPEEEQDEPKVKRQYTKKLNNA